MITVAWHWGCYKSPPLQEISSRDLSAEVKSNFGRTDPYRVNYLVNNSGNEAEVSLELKVNKTSRAKYEGTIGGFKRMDKRLIPEPSVRKGFRASRIYHLSEGGSWHDTKPIARIFWNQRYTGESGSDPVELWVMSPPCGLKVERGLIVRHVRW